MILADAPDTLKDPEEQSSRAKLLEQSHAAPLTDYVTSLRATFGEGYHIPDFDPCDGGVQARVLFLLEAPGPQAIKSGFVSSNNPDPTAQNLWTLIHDTGIIRSDVILWNIVPWYVGNGKKIRTVSRADISQALPYLKELLALLPRLTMIVLVGRKAQSAEMQIRVVTSLPISHTYHMSAQVFNVWPKKRQETQNAFARIAQFLKLTRNKLCLNHFLSTKIT